MSENPFAEPGDQDRTVIRPTPGGARAARAALLPAAPAPPPKTAVPLASGPDIEAVVAGEGPLAKAAAPLLHLLARLRNAASAPDPGDMRERTRRELRAFERRARDAGVAPDQLRLAHYALCAALDDVVLNTPWGNHGRWKDEPLAKALHHDENAGRGFFDQVRALRDAMPGSRPVLELMFLCLSLGMMGPYRGTPDGPAQLERVRHRVFELISATPVSAALSDAVAGVDARAAPARGGVPVWVGASAAIAAVAGVYMWGLTGLNAASDEVYQAALAAPPGAMPALVRPAATPPPPPPPAPPPGPAERLRAALADVPDIEVIGGAAATTVRIPAKALFPQPNATPAGPVLDRVAAALQHEAGPIRILAFTDSQPSRTAAFPSNFALSTARAKAVRAVLARTLPEPARIVADGRADADPVVPNTTAENRERNRRVDIVLPGSP